jgi:hypothetical protein
MVVLTVVNFNWMLRVAEFFELVLSVPSKSLLLRASL